MIDKIRTQKQYNQVMGLIETYLQKATEGGGFDHLKKAEATELQRLSMLAADYEDNVMKIMPLPVTISGMVNHKMEEMNITRAKLAEMLGMGSPKLSQILNGKREPDVPFLKAIYQKLQIDPGFILEHA